MTVMDNEDPADPSVHEPRVTGSPEAIWLVYGDLEHDDTHGECCRSGEVTWSEDSQFPADVRYVLASKAEAEIAHLCSLVDALRLERNVLQKISARRAGALERVGLHADCTMEDAQAAGARLAGLGA